MNFNLLSKNLDNSKDIDISTIQLVQPIISPLPIL